MLGLEIGETSSTLVLNFVSLDMLNVSSNILRYRKTCKGPKGLGRDYDCCPLIAHSKSTAKVQNERESLLGKGDSCFKISGF